MKLREIPGALDRVQRARWFKVAASIMIVLIVVGGYVWYTVGVENGTFAGADAVLHRLDTSDSINENDPRVQMVRGILSDASVTISAAVAAAAAIAVGVIVVWLGLGITYLVIGLAAALIAGPMLLLESTEVYGKLLLGVLLLAASFTALMQALRVLFSGSGPVMGIARNLLTEAVRMKISLVLIILMILGLAVLPGMLDGDQPLRYRVQSFFQYSVTGVFWILAFLTLAFGIASITSEQRDKTIWQTVTKPVAAWKYLLGKWLGLVGLNAVLLLVSSSGIFLFAEYLRNQPAIGETRAYLATDSAVSEDRFILESRVMTARESKFMEIPERFSRDGEIFQQRVDQFIAKERLTDPNFATTPSDYKYVASNLYTAMIRAYRSIPPGESRLYTISGLEKARNQSSPITLRFRIDSQGNRPDAFYDMTFSLPYSQDPAPLVKRMGLGFYHNISLTPESINEDGVLDILIFNGKVIKGEQGMGIIPNPSTASIPERGLEISYRAGGYRTNFMRVMLVMWVKLAFLAMLAVWTSTFLSFPVACLVSFGVFMIAEMSGFLISAADLYGTTDQKGNIVWVKFITTNITNLVGQLFSVYSDMKPVRRLVDGRMMPWSSVAVGTGVLATITVLLFGLAVGIFRKRELATYSGN